SKKNRFWLLKPHTSDLDGGYNNINSRDDQQVSKLTESPLQEQNLSAPKNYVYDCVATRECICELVGEWEPCGTVALDYCKQYGNSEKIKCKWNGTPKKW
ncbi:15418_t:CDS:2, partial [Gigaspora margarita]